MSKRGILSVGDTITTKKYGRWTIVDFQDEYVLLVKIRKGKVTETFKMRLDRVMSK